MLYCLFVYGQNKNNPERVALVQNRYIIYVSLHEGTRREILTLGKDTATLLVFQLYSSKSDMKISKPPKRENGGGGKDIHIPKNSSIRMMVTAFLKPSDPPFT